MKGQSGIHAVKRTLERDYGEVVRRVEADGDIGLLLPCNVVVQAGADGTTVVEAVDPVVQLGVAGGETLESLAGEVQSRLVGVMNRVEEANA